ncbi:MAG: hypothetical protein QOK40_907 [Miltoncostaeaceae bacterium]|nr:hypothetical protein [Miltoncostaeaceae bacterium]
MVRIAATHTPAAGLAAIELVEGPQGRLALRRARPRRDGRLMLQYAGAHGALVAGQWHPDPAMLGEVADATPDSILVRANGTRVLVQPGGADRRLAALAPLARMPGSVLLVHRVERHAVVRTPAPDGPRYVKVVVPKRTAGVAAAARAAERLLGGNLAVPRLVAVDAQRGLLTFSEVPGRTLGEFLAGEAAAERAALITGRALRAVHDTPPAPGLAPRGHAEEAKRLRSLIGRVAPYDRELAAAIAQAAGPALDRLAAAPPGTAVVHGDFHERQVILDADGRPGMVDFDTLGIGDPALDLANVLVRLELRAMLGGCTRAVAERAAAALLDAHDPAPATIAAIPAYADVVRLRIACSFVLRPAHPALSRLVLARLGRPPGTALA